MTESHVMLMGQGFATLYGLVIGSFWNVAIARLPEGISLWPRSTCPHCGGAIAAKDNVPVLAWLWLRGRCRTCSSPISPKYPLTELLGGLLGLLLFRSLIPTLTELDAGHIAAWVVQFTFLSLLAIGAFVDLRHRILPDEVTIYAVPLGIGGALLMQYFGYEGWLSVSWREAVLGALVWPLMFWFVALIGRIWSGGEVLGYGDVKLMAMLGAFLGPVGAFVAVMWGSTFGAAIGIVALIYMRRRAALPFGPPLAVGAAVFLLYGESFARVMLPMWRL